MVRETSIQTYREIEASGLLSKKRMEVYRILYEHGPLSGAQVSKIHGDTYGANTISETVRNRITELFEMGVVREVSKGPCPITGREVIFWNTTDAIPLKIKKKTRRQLKEEILKDVVELGQMLQFNPVPRQKLLKIYYKLKKL